MSSKSGLLLSKLLAGVQVRLPPPAEVIGGQASAQEDSCL